MATIPVYLPERITPDLPAPVSFTVEAWLAGRTSNTQTAYRADLKGFARWQGVSVGDAADGFLQSAGRGHALALGYQAHLLDQGKAPRSVNRALATLGSLLKFARRIGAASWSLEIDPIRTRAIRDTKGPPVESIRAMLEAAENNRKNPHKGTRDAAILWCLFGLALRRSELSSLDLEHYDQAAGTLAIMGKGKREREFISIAGPVAAALSRWLEVRGSSPGPLFLSARKGGTFTGRLLADGVWRSVRDLGKAVGIRCWPHALRHSAVTVCLDVTGGDVRTAQRFARHADPGTTTLYDDNRRDLGGRGAALVAKALDKSSYTA